MRAYLVKDLSEFFDEKTAQAIVDIQKKVDDKVREEVRQKVKEYDDACYDFLMNGTDAASDASLELLGYERTYSKDRL